MNPSGWPCHAPSDARYGILSTRGLGRQFRGPVPRIPPKIPSESTATLCATLISSQHIEPRIQLCNTVPATRIDVGDKIACIPCGRPNYMMRCGLLQMHDFLIRSKCRAQYKCCATARPLRVSSPPRGSKVKLCGRRGRRSARDSASDGHTPISDRRG